MAPQQLQPQQRHLPTHPETMSEPFAPSQHPEPRRIPVRFRGTLDLSEEDGETFHIDRAMGSTSKGILIGMLSAFGSALLVAIILGLIYFFRCTSRGRILLDRLGRPGEYDDEQAFAKEEAEALEEMDDIQRMEYMRAKGDVWNGLAFDPSY